MGCVPGMDLSPAPLCKEPPSAPPATVADSPERVDRDEDEVRQRAARPIRCRPCGAAVTEVRHRAERNGAHRHVFANPHGLVFELALYAAAPGCAVACPASTEFSWFQGRAWRVALCRACGAHLGWRFEATTDGGGVFWGLIETRLVEEG